MSNPPPTTKLQIDVDLENGSITKITDPETTDKIETNISLKKDDLNTSKAEFNEKFNELNPIGLNNPAFGVVKGGAPKHRLSRRRQRGSNKKMFLVRNKSKKMRRGKYSRKAK